MEVLDLFSAAAGGWSLGLHRAGFRTLAACEVVDWRRALYAENNPHVRLYDDVRTLTADRLLADLGRLPAVIVGSPPCQDISPANTSGKGVEGDRSSLYFDATRLVGEVRPRWFAFENSHNLRTRGADAVLAELEALGYACWPCVVRAGDIGANHERPRSWLIGCNLDEVAHPDGHGRAAEWRRGRGWLDVSYADDADERTDDEHTASIGHACGRPRGCRSDGHGSPSIASGDDGNAAQDGCGSGRSWRCAEPAEGLSISACGNAADAHGGKQREQPGRRRGPGGTGPTLDGLHDPQRHLGDAADADETRQAHGCVVAGVRQAEVADDGRGDGRCDDGSSDGEVGGCPGAGDPAPEPWADWNGGLAGHLRVDDGLSAWVAGTRIAVGGPKGTAAAALIVEAFGDAVVPQIPAAIGRAILRTEAALASIYGRPADAAVRAVA